MWQDYAIAVIQFAFAAALLPAVLGEEKPDKWTCVFTGGLLYLLAGVFTTIPMWVSGGASILAASMWTILLFQKRGG